jgi:CHAD domain-containing protein
VQAAITDGLSQLSRFAPGACLGSDPEDVHKARVATRRLRSQLRSFSVAFDAAWVDTARAELGWLAGGLGAVRDVDVMIERIQGFEVQLGADDRKVADTLVERLQTRRAEAAQSLRSDFESTRCASLVELLRAAASDPPLGAVGSEPASSLASTLVARSWRQLERSVSALPRDPSDADLHEVRIRTKRCRYTTEMVVPVTGGDARRLVRALVELQGVLGDIHDSYCTRTWLRTSAESVAEGLVAGMIIAAEERDYAALADSWRRVWVKAMKVKPADKPK